VAVNHSTRIISKNAALVERALAAESLKDRNRPAQVVQVFPPSMASCPWLPRGPAAPAHRAPPACQGQGICSPIWLAASHWQHNVPPGAGKSLNLRVGCLSGQVHHYHHHCGGCGSDGDQVSDPTFWSIFHRPQPTLEVFVRNTNQSQRSSLSGP
jgi:hypothetical protein